MMLTAGGWTRRRSRAGRRGGCRCWGRRNQRRFRRDCRSCRGGGRGRKASGGGRASWGGWGQGREWRRSRGVLLILVKHRAALIRFQCCYLSYKRIFFHIILLFYLFFFFFKYIWYIFLGIKNWKKRLGLSSLSL